MEKIIHFTTAHSPTQKQLAYIEKARQLHPEWEVRVWMDPVETKDFRLAHYHSNANSGAQLADLIRLDVVYLYGGIYLDSDIELVKTLDALASLDSFFCSENGYSLTNAAYGATKENPLILAIIEELLKNEPDWQEKPHITTGPLLFSRVLRWKKDAHILPRDSFYPYNWNESESLPTPATLGIHKWDGSWLSTEQTIYKKKILSSKQESKNGLKTRLKRVLHRILSRITANASQGNRLSLAYPTGADLVAKSTRGIFFSLPGSDLSITPELAINGTYEEREQKFLEKYLKGGDYFVDIGCNVGVFTLLAAKLVGPFGRVYAYDANDSVLTYLSRSLVMNWVHDRVCIVNKAVGADHGTITLEYSTHCLGGASHSLDIGSVFHRTTEALGDIVQKIVDVVSLDSEFPLDVEIKILKIDVEGHEHSVLHGASRLIGTRSINYIILELLEEVSSSMHRYNIEAVRKVMKCGYAPHLVLEDGSLQLISDFNQTRIKGRNLVLGRI